MSDYVFKAYRVYEGRTVETEYATDLETAKELARNMVVLESPPEWVEDGHWKWKLKGYGELNAGCYIKKHVLKGGSDD